MSKSENLLVKFLIALVGITIGAVVVLSIIAYQIGVDELEKPNRIAIIGGLLSMVGGIAGAFGAYFIAKWQMTILLERQDEKDRKKIAWEININKKQEALQILNIKISEFQKLKEEYVKCTITIMDYLEVNDSEDIINPDTLFSRYADKVETCIESANELEKAYQIIFSYKSFFSGDFAEEIEEFKEKYKEFNSNLFDFLHFSNYMGNEYPFEEFSENWLKEKKKMNQSVGVISFLLKEQMKNLDLELFEIVNI